MRQADDAYSRYQDYKSMGDDAKSRAETELRYAEDYERRWHDGGDDMDHNSASECYSSARIYLNEAERYYSQADDYYRDYEENKSRAEWEKNYG